jgi:hypothetical protein
VKMKRRAKRPPTQAAVEPKKNPSQIGLYFGYVWALLVPGKTVRTFETLRGEPAAIGELGAWDDSNLQLLIEEGRLRFESQSNRFDRIRQTAQVVLPTGVALLVVVGTELHRIMKVGADEVRYGLYAGWAVAIALVLFGTLGSASILVTKAVFGSVLPTLISQQDPSKLRLELARSYADQSIVGEDSLNTRLTLQWWSVSFVALGGLLFSILWLFRQFQ